MAKPTGKKRKDERADAAKTLPRQEEAEGLAAAFKALGDPTRLRIVLFLRAAAQLAEQESEETLKGFDERQGESGSETEEDETPTPDGVTVGEVACYLTGSEKVTSSVSHHLKELRHAGLVTMKRRGKNILCRLDNGTVSVLCRLLAEPPK